MLKFLHIQYIFVMFTHLGSGIISGRIQYISVKLYYFDQGRWNLVRVGREFELFEFKLTG